MTERSAPPQRNDGKRARHRNLKEKMITTKKSLVVERKVLEMREGTPGEVIRPIETDDQKESQLGIPIEKKEMTDMSGMIRTTVMKTHRGARKAMVDAQRIEALRTNGTHP